jgi:hypothetical protein
LAQLVAHILYFFSEPGDLVLDPMAGGGVCADTCLAMGWRHGHEKGSAGREQIPMLYRILFHGGWM